MFGRSPPSVETPIPGPSAERWVEALARTECPSLTARRARRAERSGASHDPIVWAQALGSNVRDVDGNVFVDLTAGFGVAAIGHAHPRVVRAIQEQAGKLVHALGDVHPSVPKIEICERLASMMPWEARVILGQNGSDAIGAALKTAVLATGRAGVIAFDGGYHGLTYAPLALCGYSSAFRDPFAAQLSPHVRFAPYPGDLAETLRAVDEALDGSIGAIVVEPALGRGGVVFPPEAFLPELEARCREHGALLIVDEIFTGFGRAGARFLFEGNVRPDIVCVGKALGGGMPISACIGSADVMRAWGDPDKEAIHTMTFAGHPIACAAALATLDVIDDEALIDRSARVGEAFADRLREAGCAVRGRGLMLGIERDDALSSVRVLLTRGYIALAAGRRAEIVSLTPPLTIDESLLDGLVSALP
jgi:4-aminobutyrate aminotransferase/(S)-3-amino-2-methylpropionate transaminase